MKRATTLEFTRPGRLELEKRKAKRAEKKAAKAGTTASAPISKEPVFDTLVVDDDGDDDTPIRRRTPSA